MAERFGGSRQTPTFLEIVHAEGLADRRYSGLVWAKHLMIRRRSTDAEVCRVGELVGEWGVRVLQVPFDLLITVWSTKRRRREVADRSSFLSFLPPAHEHHGEAAQYKEKDGVQTENAKSDGGVRHQCIHILNQDLIRRDTCPTGISVDGDVGLR